MVLHLVHSYFTLCLRVRDYLNYFPNAHGTAFG